MKLIIKVNGDIASDKLQARVLFNDYDPKDEEMVLTANAATKEVIDKFLRWEVLNNENKVVNILIQIILSLQVKILWHLFLDKLNTFCQLCRDYASSRSSGE